MKQANFDFQEQVKITPWMKYQVDLGTRLGGAGMLMEALRRQDEIIHWVFGYHTTGILCRPNKKIGNHSTSTRKYSNKPGGQDGPFWG